MKDNYNSFLESKRLAIKNVGFKITNKDLSKILFPYQKDIVKWCVLLGKAAIFSATGTGKTFMQLEYARLINKLAGCKVLIVAPLAVSNQTVEEAKKLGMHVSNLRHGEEIIDINIINYEQLDNIDCLLFDCVVLDESSILKNYASKTKNTIIEKFHHAKYKLACTATPAPNDFMELGNHAEFLDIMTRKEMLSMYFIHDSGETQTWRVKGHAEDKFWEFVASWAVIFTKPSDLGYSDEGFELPPLKYHEIITKSEVPDGCLFTVEAKTLTQRRKARKNSLTDRVDITANLVNKSKEIFITWCNLNLESEMLTKKIKGSVEIAGKHNIEYKEKNMLDFGKGKIKNLVSKPEICGFGLNWQVCHNVVFVGLSDSFEQFFQAIRRCWRFGQKHTVNVYIIISEAEGAVLRNIKRKEADAQNMIAGMVEHTKRFVMENIKNNANYKTVNNHKLKIIIPEWLKEIL